MAAAQLPIRYVAVDPTVPTAIVSVVGILTMILKHLFPNEKPLIKEQLLN